jgi:hypothetical protein
VYVAEAPLRPSVARTVLAPSATTGTGNVQLSFPVALAINDPAVQLEMAAGPKVSVRCAVGSYPLPVATTELPTVPLLGVNTSVGDRIV